VQVTNKSAGALGERNAGW